MVAVESRGRTTIGVKWVSLKPSIRDTSRTAARLIDLGGVDGLATLLREVRSVQALHRPRQRPTNRVPAAVTGRPIRSAKMLCLG